MGTFGEYVFRVMEDERCKLGMNTLLDCSEATPMPHSREQERSYSQFADRLTEESAAIRRKVAVMTGDSLVNFGVSRMREVPLSDSPIEMRVFQTTAEALAWLGLSPEIEPELITDTVFS